MKRFIVLLFLFVFIPALSAASEDGYIVEVKKDKLAAALALGAEGSTNLCLENICYVKVMEEALAKQMVQSGIAARYEENTPIPIEPPVTTPDYSLFSPFSTFSIFDTSYPNDSYFYSQWELTNSVINWQGGYDVITRTNNYATARVAVLDSGFVSSHPDADYSKITCVNINLSPIQCSDISNGWDDRFGGHGTSVTGMLAAKMNNNLGIAPVSFGKATTLSVKLNRASDPNFIDRMSIINALAAIQRVYNSDQLVAVNISSGSYGEDSAYSAYINTLRTQGIIVVNSAGNDNLNMSSSPHYPTSYPLDNIIGVAAIHSGLYKASFSNYGGYADIAAPGDWVYVFSNDNDPYVPVRYYQGSGTSFATPYITAVLAAGKALGSGVTNQRLVQLLYYTATRDPNLKYQVRNGKIVNVGAFLAAVKMCQANLSACNAVVPGTFPVRANMNNLPNPDPDNVPRNWFPPNDVQAKVTGTKQITITWPESQYLADTINISWSHNYGSWAEVNLPAKTGSYVLNDLMPGNYPFKIRSVKNGVYSGIVQREAPLYLPAPYVQEIYLESDDIDYVENSFIVPDGFTKMMYRIEGYDGVVSIYIDGNPFISAEFDSIENTASVQAGQLITVYLRNDNQMSGTVRCWIGFSGWYQPEDLHSVAAGGNNIKLMWTPPANQPDAYVLYWRPGGNNWNEVTLLPDATSYEFHAPYAGYYYFELRAVKDGFYSEALSKDVTIGNPPQVVELYSDANSELEFTVPVGYNNVSYAIASNIGGSGNDSWGRIYVDGELKVDVADGWNDTEGSFPVMPGQLIRLEAFANINYMEFVRITLTLTE